MTSQVDETRPREVKRKLTAILSADVKGYSRLMGEDEKGTVRTLNAYKEVMAGLIQHHRGRVVDAPGSTAELSQQPADPVWRDAHIHGGDTAAAIRDSALNPRQRPAASVAVFLDGRVAWEGNGDTGSAGFATTPRPGRISLKITAVSDSINLAGIMQDVSPDAN